MSDLSHLFLKANKQNKGVRFGGQWNGIVEWWNGEIVEWRDDRLKTLYRKEHCGANFFMIVDRSGYNYS